MWNEADYYPYLLSDEWYDSLGILDEVTDACLGPPALCAIGVRRMHGRAAPVR